MRHIGLFCERWESGGIEALLYNALTRMDLPALRVDIVTAALEESLYTKPLEERDVCFFQLSGSLRNIRENHRRFKALLAERRWDVLHVNAFQSLSLAYLKLAAEAGIPVRIAHGHNTALRRSLTKPLKLLIHAAARERYTPYATDLWACSENAAGFIFSKKELRQRGFQFIPNGIDTERFRFDPAERDRTRRELGLTDAFVIGSVGRLCAQKNQSFLLEVLAELAKENPAARLLLVGEGEDRPRLERKAQRLGVSDRVLFPGNRRDVERLYWSMDAFAFPSLFEGLGIAAIEAQAAGLPVLCSEAVPEEARVTEQLRVLPLKAGAAAWAAALRAVPAGRPQPRMDEYNISRTAALMRTGWLGEQAEGDK